MLLNDYTVFTRTTAIYPKEQALDYLALGLSSEAGEVAGKIKKRIRDGHFSTADLVAEIGDVLWYCTRMCDELNVPLEVCFRENMEKLSSRKARNVIGGSGDHR